MDRLGNQGKPGARNPDVRGTRRENASNELRNRREWRYGAVQRQVEELSVHESSGESPAGRGRVLVEVAALAKELQDLKDKVEGKKTGTWTFLKSCPFFSRDNGLIDFVKI